MKVWLNDQLCDSKEIEIGSEGWPTGSGVFETIRTENGLVYELERHMRRAASAARQYQFKLPSEELIRKAISQILDSEPYPIGRMRLLFSEDRFIAVHQRYDEIKFPAKLMIANAESQITPISYKTFPYNHRLALLEEANHAGFDEIICLSESGEVAEGAVSSFLFFIDGQWVTTPLSVGVLPGVQRAITIERCGVKVTSLNRGDLAKVASAIVISSLKIALPAISIDNRQLDLGEGVASMVAQIRAQTHAHSVG